MRHVEGGEGDPLGMGTKERTEIREIQEIRCERSLGEGSFKDATWTFFSNKCSALCNVTSTCNFIQYQ